MSAPTCSLTYLESGFFKIECSTTSRCLISSTTAYFTGSNDNSKKNCILEFVCKHGLDTTKTLLYNNKSDVSSVVRRTVIFYGELEILKNIADHSTIQNITKQQLIGK